MIGMFKSRNWKPQVIGDLRGTSNGISVLLRNFPCRVDEADGSRTYAYDDFGAEFLQVLSGRQLGNFDLVDSTISSGAEKSVDVKLRDLSPFEVRVSGRTTGKRDQFYSDLADALIEAFRSQSIKP